MNAPFELTWRRKQQAAMLYHFASSDYLTPALERVNRIIGLVDDMLNLSNEQGRDKYLVSDRWGVRHTAANWSTYGYPFLLQLREGTIKQIALRAFEIYRRTLTNECARGLQELTMDWSTPDEQARFDELFADLSKYCLPIDRTVARQSVWDDMSFALTWREVRSKLPRIPKFVVSRTSVGESGRLPSRTGVYVPQDDPHGAMQFAWTGDAGGILANSVTFDTLGLKALEFVGRDAMWLDHQKMYAFATQPEYLPQLRQDMLIGDKTYAECAPGAIAACGLMERPCKWYLVEAVEGEFEESEPPPPPNGGRLRGFPDEIVPVTGWWDAVALSNGNGHRHFRQGERFPPGKYSEMGEVIWNYDPTDQPR